MEMMLIYVDAIDNTEFIKTLLFEKDYQGRDALAIAVELNLMDLIKSPKLVAAINRIYKSDYECSGSLFEMSSAYQLVKMKINGIDYEKNFRFYKRRQLKEFKQTECNYKVYRLSMYSRLKGKIVVRVLFLIFIFYYKVVVLNDIILLREKLPVVIESGSRGGSTIEPLLSILSENLLYLFLLLLPNLMFFGTRITKFVILPKIGKKMDLMNFATVTDGTMFAMAILALIWSQNLRILINRNTELSN